MDNKSHKSIEDGLLLWYRSRIRTRDPITTETDLLDAGYLDSLMLMELVVSLEEKYGVSIDSEEVSPQNFRSIHSLASFVVQRSAA
jgi:acyl carrier protein